MSARLAAEGRRGSAGSRLAKKGVGAASSTEQTCADVAGGSERARGADRGGATRSGSTAERSTRSGRVTTRLS